MFIGQPHFIIAAWLLLARIVSCQMYEDYDVQYKAKPTRRTFQTKNPDLVLVKRTSLAQRLGKAHPEVPTRKRIKPPDLWLGNIALVSRQARTSQLPLISLLQRIRSFEPAREKSTSMSAAETPQTLVFDADAKTTVRAHIDSTEAIAVGKMPNVDPWKSILQGTPARTTARTVNKTMNPPANAKTGIPALRGYSRSWLRSDPKSSIPAPQNYSKPALREDMNTTTAKLDTEPEHKGNLDPTAKKPTIAPTEAVPTDIKETVLDDTTPTLASIVAEKSMKAFPLVWAYIIIGAGAVAMIMLLSAILGMLATVYGTRRKCRKTTSCPCDSVKTFGSKSLRFTCGNVQTGKKPAGKSAAKNVLMGKSATNVLAGESAATAQTGRPNAIAQTGSATLNQFDHDRSSPDTFDARNGLAYPGPNVVPVNTRSARGEPYRDNDSYRNNESYRDSNNDIRFAAQNCACECDCPETTDDEQTRAPKRENHIERDSRTHRMTARDGFAYEHEERIASRSRSGKRENQSDRDSKAQRMAARNDTSYEYGDRIASSKRSHSAKRKKNLGHKSSKNSMDHKTERPKKTDASNKTRSAKRKKKSGRSKSNENDHGVQSKKTHSSKGMNKSDRSNSSESVEVFDDSEYDHHEAQPKKSRKGKVDIMCECPEPTVADASMDTRTKRKTKSTRIMCCTETMVVPNDAKFPELTITPACHCPSLTFKVPSPGKQNGDYLQLDDDGT